ncbi:MAG TPA: acyltransferase, partial [Steroidobacteraceae bacterium]|nr:acyltransferase [Steroidobacteraceae bacterium]
EHLRAIAILLVLCHHFTWVQPFLPTILWDAWSGVDLFFAISGYVITLSFSRTFAPARDGASLAERVALNRSAIRAFFRRRFWRIMPPLAATFVLAAVFTAILGITRWKDLLVEALAAFSMTYNYVVYGGGPFLLDVLWSLALEMQFYLLLPFFVLAFPTDRKLLWAAVSVFLIVGVIVRPLHVLAFTSTPQDWLKVRFATHCRLDSLAAGVAVFALSRHARVLRFLRTLTPFTIRGLAFFFLGILLLIPAGTGVEFSHVAGFSFLALAAAGLVLLSAAGNLTIVPFTAVRDVLDYIGRRSFSLYLVHRLAAAAFRTAFPTVASRVNVMGGLGLEMRILESAGTLALTWALAELMYRYVERPGIEVGRYYGARALSVMPRPLTTAPAR